MISIPFGVFFFNVLQNSADSCPCNWITCKSYFSIFSRISSKLASTKTPTFWIDLGNLGSDFSPPPVFRWWASSFLEHWCCKLANALKLIFLIYSSYNKSGRVGSSTDSAGFKELPPEPAPRQDLDVRAMAFRTVLTLQFYWQTGLINY